jgi:hypothetical protein
VYVARKRAFAVPGVEAAVLVHGQTSIDLQHVGTHSVAVSIASPPALERGRVLCHAKETPEVEATQTDTRAFLVT